MTTPNEVIKQLSEPDRDLLNTILGIEKKHLHELKIKPNSKIEKSIIDELQKAVEKAIPDED